MRWTGKPPNISQTRLISLHKHQAPLYANCACTHSLHTKKIGDGIFTKIWDLVTLAIGASTPALQWGGQVPPKVNATSTPFFLGGLVPPPFLIWVVGPPPLLLGWLSTSQQELEHQSCCSLFIEVDSTSSLLKLGRRAHSNGSVTHHARIDYNLT